MALNSTNRVDRGGVGRWTGQLGPGRGRHGKSCTYWSAAQLPPVTRQAAGARAEHLQFGDPVLVADGSQALLVNLDARDDHHDPRLTLDWRHVRD